MERGEMLKESVYKSYDELPLFLNTEMVAKLLGMSPSSAYELMHEKGRASFPRPNPIVRQCRPKYA